jgi:hypothetical protein
MIKVIFSYSSRQDKDLRKLSVSQLSKTADYELEFNTEQDYKEAYHLLKLYKELTELKQMMVLYTVGSTRVNISNMIGYIQGNENQTYKIKRYEDLEASKR